MKILKEILSKYNDQEFIDIYNIVKEYWLKIIEWNFEDVDWMLFENYIWIQKNMRKEQKRFVVAHEFCHFLLNERSFSVWIYHSTSFSEKRADKFATDILLPKKAVLEKYEEYEDITTLAQIFWVPIKVVEMRLNHLLCNWFSRWQ